MKSVRTIIAISCLLFGSVLTTNAQEVDYHKVAFSINLKPTILLDEQVKTFDYEVMIANRIEADGDAAKLERIKEGLARNLTLNLGRLQQTAANGDLHVISLVHLYAAKQYAKAVSGTGFTLTTSVNYHTNVYTKTGELIYSYSYVNPDMATSFTENWSADDIKKNDAAVRQKISSQAINNSLAGFAAKITGGPEAVNSQLADLDDVKKLPELKVMEDQRKSLEKILSGQGVDAFIKAAQEYIPFWEKQTAFNANEDSNEVKRAVYQNLALYYLLNKETEKAVAIIDAYKPIDKTIKEMMGLIKYKNSEKLEELIAVLAPAETKVTIAAGAPTYTAAELADKQRFEKVEGTITIDDKKRSGTYTGIVKFFKPEPGKFDAGSSGIASLDADNPRIIINTSENGAPKVVETNLSKITSLTDKDSKKYTVIKSGSALLGGSIYSLMKEVYHSDKIAAFKNPLEITTEYLFQKTGDEKGMRLTIFNAKKNLLEYFAGCEPAINMIKEAKSVYRIDVEKLAAVYTDCK